MARACEQRGLRHHRRRHHRLRDRPRVGDRRRPDASWSSSADNWAPKRRAPPPACWRWPAAARRAVCCSSSSARARRCFRPSPTRCAAETGIDVEYATGGLLDLAFTSRDAELLDRLVARRQEQGFAVERLGCRQRAARVTPRSIRRCAAAPGSPTTARSTTCSLVEALQASARARGVEFRLGAAVTRIAAQRQRVTAVEAGGRAGCPRPSHHRRRRVGGRDRRAAAV